MAQKVNIVLVDDMDGTEAEETVSFALDGVAYEIDLNAKHAAALRKALTPYVDKARRVAGRRTRGTGAAAAAAASTTPRRAGRKRVATVEEIEASKGKAKSA